MAAKKKKWRIELGSLIKEHGFDKGVELGVYRGKSFYHSLKSNPQLNLTGIDTWKSTKGYPQNKLHAYEMICRTISLLFGNRARLIKQDANECVHSFADGSLDFIHYDLFNFRISTVSLHETTLRLWIPKLKKNGLLIGRNFSKIDIATALHNLGVHCEYYIDGQNSSKRLLYAAANSRDIIFNFPALAQVPFF